MWGRVAGAAVMLMCLLPGTAGAARFYGFNDNSTLSHDLTPAQDARLLAQTGANSARITVDWTWVEPSEGKLDLSMYDPVYNAWIASGIRPLMIVTGSPEWAWPPLWEFPSCTSGEPCHVPPDPVKDRDWSRFVTAVAARYPLAAGIEVWNEPNLRGFWATGPDPGRYTQLLREAHSAVKAVNPVMPVVGGALAGVLGQDTGDEYGLQPFLRGMYANGAKGAMDGISVHAYPTDGTTARVLATVDAVRQVRDEAGDATPLWVTEVGASTSAGFSEADQASLLSQVLPALIGSVDVDAVYVHTLVDPAEVWPADPEHGYGVMRDATQRKPAFCAVTDAFPPGTNLLTRLGCSRGSSARHRAHRRARRR